MKVPIGLLKFPISFLIVPKSIFYFTMTEKSKCNQISIEKKLKILAEVDKKSVLKSEIGKMFNLKKGPSSQFWKPGQVSSANEAGVSQSRICSRDGKFPVLKKALIKWTHSLYECSYGNFLKEKTKTFAEKINIDVDLKASDGWFEKFKSRCRLVFKKMWVESASVDFNCFSGCRKEQLKCLLDKFEPKDFLNTNEWLQIITRWKKISERWN